MPDFHEVQLDVGIDYGMTGGAEFETEIVATAGGRETRGIVYPADLGSWQLGERSIAKATLTYLDGFFRARHGMAYGFRAKIWGDYVLPRADRRGERQPDGVSDLQDLPGSLSAVQQEPQKDR